MGYRITGKAWAADVMHCCQPLAFISITQAWRKELYESHILEPAQFDVPLLRIEEDHPPLESSRGRLVPSKVPRSMVPLCAVAFGIHPVDATASIKKSIKAEELGLVSAPPFRQFVKACMDMRGLLSWLDLASCGLASAQNLAGAGNPPTVVVVESLVSDLALFWSLRMNDGMMGPTEIIPMPSCEVSSQESIEAVAEWIRTSRVDSNYCIVTSEAAPSAATNTLAAKLRRRLKGSKRQYVDVQDALRDWGGTIPEAKRMVLTADLTDRTLSFRAPAPEVSRRARLTQWMVDIVEMTEVRRDIGELCLPNQRAMRDALQASTPPYLGMSLLRHVGYGPNGLMFLISKRDELVRFRLPTAFELCDAQLHAHGFRMKPDEKRLRYEAAIERCGGLDRASGTVKGLPGLILQGLEKQGSLTQRGIASLIAGQPKAAETHWDALFRHAIERQPAAARRITERRFAGEYAITPDTDLNQILARLHKRGVIDRRIKLDRCSLCGDQSWLERIDLQRPVSCPGCGSPRVLPQNLQVGFDLNPLIATAIKEGWIPVVLAGEFLKNLTVHGFLWVPGVKAEYAGGAVDFDIFACCDGHIVVVECKTLEDAKTPPWKEIRVQFQRTIQAGKVCGAEMAVFACRAKEVSPSFQKGLAKVAGPNMSVQVLTRDDLVVLHI
ncbi:MAG: hypothetical protein NTU94_06120 [Planctomycetota bacterium]|nr:hypothetical protein [Planctomycetota bacterium]